MDIKTTKCCENCIHSRPIPDPVNLRTMYRCKANPPTAHAVPVQDASGRVVGVKIDAVWPVLVAGEECDTFSSKDLN